MTAKVGQRFIAKDGVSLYQALTVAGVPQQHLYWRPTSWEIVDVRLLPYREDLQEEIEAGDRNKDLDRLVAAIGAGHFNPKPKPAAPPSNTERVVQLTELLRTLAEQADEDCPAEFRSDHFRCALNDAFAALGQSAADVFSATENLPAFSFTQQAQPAPAKDWQ